MSKKTISRRDIKNSFSDNQPYWMDNSQIKTAVMNSLSTLFPKGERFFVDSVRYYRDKYQNTLPKKTLNDIKGFIAQEAMHSREHDAMNTWVSEHGYDIQKLEKRLGVVLAIARFLPPSTQLAVTCSLEHVTAMMAEMLIDRDDVRSVMSEDMKKLWVWHALEEVEHKSVAFDLYKNVADKYWERVGTHIMSTTLLAAVTLGATADLVIQDKKQLKFSDVISAYKFFWGSDGAFSSLIPKWMSYFRPDFHPDNIDSTKSIEKGKALLSFV